MNPKALGPCKMIKHNTIGSHSKGIYMYLNENNYSFKDYCDFFNTKDGADNENNIICK
jgi:hypothetical protein